nr:hypothetical protein GCM10010200_092800 [Actinomadura rugatobispora]
MPGASAASSQTPLTADLGKMVRDHTAVKVKPFCTGQARPAHNRPRPVRGPSQAQVAAWQPLAADRRAHQAPGRGRPDLCDVVTT